MHALCALCRNAPFGWMVSGLSADRTVAKEASKYPFSNNNGFPNTGTKNGGDGGNWGKIGEKFARCAQCAPGALTYSQTLGHILQHEVTTRLPPDKANLAFFVGNIVCFTS